jgi:hypothetical protein
MARTRSPVRSRKPPYKLIDGTDAVAELIGIMVPPIGRWKKLESSSRSALDAPEFVALVKQGEAVGIRYDSVKGRFKFYEQMQRKGATAIDQIAKIEREVVTAILPFSPFPEWLEMMVRTNVNEVIKLGLEIQQDDVPAVLRDLKRSGFNYRQTAEKWDTTTILLRRMVTSQKKGGDRLKY